MRSPFSMSSLLPELDFETSRSSGPGGQNVNKVNTKVTVRFDVAHSRALDAAQKQMIQKALASRMVRGGVLIVSAQEKRSQGQNKDAALNKLEALLGRALTPRRRRHKTKPSMAAHKKRLDRKKKRGETKKLRGRLRP